jgi:hypothetical protein
MGQKISNKYFIYDDPKPTGLKQFVKDTISFAKLCVFNVIQGCTKARPIEEKKYKVSICGIFKNEAQYLDEWICYHLLVGVNHFYMYNNNSEDDYLSVLQKYIDQGVVTLVQWEKNQAQMEAYRDCIDRFADETNWLGFIDIDEFINPIDYDDIYSFLKRFEKKYGSVLIYWKFFGTSGLKDRDRKGLVCEDFTVCWPKYSNIGKCFLNTSFKIDVEKHGMSLHHHMWTHRKGHSIPPVNSFGHLSFGYHHKVKEHFDIQINHYFTKSYAEYMEKKSKGDVYFKINPHDEAYFHYHEDKCDSVDKSIYRFIPKLKEKMGK